MFSKTPRFPSNEVPPNTPGPGHYEVKAPKEELAGPTTFPSASRFKIGHPDRSFQESFLDKTSSSTNGWDSRLQTPQRSAFKKPYTFSSTKRSNRITRSVSLQKLDCSELNQLQLEKSYLEERLYSTEVQLRKMEEQIDIAEMEKAELRSQVDEAISARLDNEAAMKDTLLEVEAQGASKEEKYKNDISALEDKISELEEDLEQVRSQKENLDLEKLQLLDAISVVRQTKEEMEEDVIAQKILVSKLEKRAVETEGQNILLEKEKASVQLQMKQLQGRFSALSAKAESLEGKLSSSEQQILVLKQEKVEDDEAMEAISVKLVVVQDKLRSELDEKRIAFSQVESKAKKVESLLEKKTELETAFADLEKELTGVKLLCKELEGEKASAEESVAKLKVEREELERGKASAEEWAEELKAKGEELEGEKASAEESVTKLKAEREELERGKASAEEWAEKLKAKGEELERAKEQTEKQLEKMEAEVSEHEVKICTLEDEMKSQLNLKEASINAISLECDELKKQLACQREDFYSEKESWHKEMESFVAKEKEFEAAIASLESQLSCLHLHCQEVEAEKATTKESLAKLTIQREELEKQTSKWQNQVKKAEDKMKKTESALTKKIRDAEAAAQSKAELTARHIEAEQEKHQLVLKSLNDQISRLEENREELRSERIELEEEQSRLISLLGELRLQMDGKDEELVTQESLIAKLEQDVNEVEDLRQNVKDIEGEKALLQFDLKQLQESMHSMSTSAQSLEVELRHAQSQVSVLSSAKAEADATVENMTGELAHLNERTERELELKQAALDEALTTFAALSEQLEDVTSAFDVERDQLVNEKSCLEAKASDLGKHVSRLDRLLVEASTKLDSVEKQKSFLEESKGKVSVENGLLLEAKDELMSQVMDFLRDLDEMKVKCADLQKVNSETEAELINVKEEKQKVLAESQCQMVELQEENERLERMLCETNEELADFKKQFLDLKTSADAETEEHVKRESEFKRIERMLKESLEASEGKVKEQRQEMSSREERFQLLRTELNRMLIDSQAKLADKEEKHAGIVAKLNGKLVSTDELASSLQREIDHLKEEKRREEMTEEIQRWKNMYEELKRKCEPFEEQLDKFEQERLALEREKLDATAEVAKLSSEYGKLLGHQNHKQKIHHVRKLKDENLSLKQEVSHLRTVIERQKHQIWKMDSSDGSSVRSFRAPLKAKQT